jgi:hypothetical protein
MSSSTRPLKPDRAALCSDWCSKAPQSAPLGHDAG